MPFYDYFCESNGRTVEVFHAMSVKLSAWGEVCRYAGIDTGPTPADAPVIRMLNRVNPTIFRVKGLDKDAPPGDRLLV